MKAVTMSMAIAALLAAIASTPLVTQAGQDLLPELPAAVDSEQLGQQRARQNMIFDLQVAQFGKITETAILHNNQVIGGSSGHNILGSGVLEHAQGISTIIQNSGHNVIIQESMIVNIHITP